MMIKRVERDFSNFEGNVELCTSTLVSATTVGNFDVNTYQMDVLESGVLFKFLVIERIEYCELFDMRFKESDSVVVNLATTPRNRRGENLLVEKEDEHRLVEFAKRLFRNDDCTESRIFTYNVNVHAKTYDSQIIAFDMDREEAKLKDREGHTYSVRNSLSVLHQDPCDIPY